MSISDLASLPDKLLPSDENDPRSVKHYRLRTALVACSSFLLVLFVVLPAMTVGLPRIGTLAWAGEVDDKIEQATAPIKAQLGQIATQLATQEQIQKRILAGQLAAQARDLHRLKCTTTDDYTRARMERDIEDAQQEYRALTGERYPLPACKDL